MTLDKTSCISAIQVFPTDVIICFTFALIFARPTHTSVKKTPMYFKENDILLCLLLLVVGLFMHVYMCNSSHIGSPDLSLNSGRVYFQV